jgi:eukaryotic-like serine/threonine-protein kinase
MNNLAGAYWRAQRLDKSIPLFEETLKLKLANLGRDHPDTHQTRANLGVNYKDAGRLKDAIPLLEKSYQAAKRVPDLHWVGLQLLDVYAKDGNLPEATKLGAALLLDIHKRLPAGSPQRAQELATLGLLLLQSKAFVESEPLLRECLAIREKTQPDAWSTFNTRSVLGGSLLGQKMYADAEPLLLAGYEGLKQREKSIPPQGAIGLPEALDRLIEFSTATNKPDQVKKWQAERAKYPASLLPPQPKI